MKRAIILLAVLFFVAVVGYFFWSLKDKDLKAVPRNTDVLVLVDSKKLSEQYILTLVKNPSKWFETSNGSFKNSGVEVADYVQIFHLKDTSFYEWYSVFEILDKDKLVKFLDEKGFKLIKNNLYKNNQFSIKIESSKCIVGFSNSNFDKTTAEIFNSKFKNLYADELINNSIASVSYFAKSKIQKFAVYLNDENIEIKTKSLDDHFSSMISDLDKQTSFLKLELDSINVKIASALFNKKLSDSIKINSLSAVAELEMVKDKIISYGYDDNFNEVEMVSYQQILQPNYSINLQSWESENLWLYFQQKNWINAQSQLTPIPFQPNVIKKNGRDISIKSTRKAIDFGQHFSGNYVFIKNNPLLINSVKSLSVSEKKAISKIDYSFYGNKSDYFYLKINFKKEKLPLILRW
ncbi:hypothetical protein [Chryseobacterium sp. FH1]|uniref:hypothetical protein n=1 Tax=Chryseobacterium sp. FH1 TaxID=1233951 RepID=UPI0004E41C02|nr:hypothetical protein [Chryseobacterium sp. FH1]KFC24444.1 hypothetical protein IO90_03885 [Chryseobacterium sp. FH1]